MRRLAARHVSTLALATACLAMASVSASAQAKGGGIFTTGYTDIGPVVGIGGINGASASFGGRFEHAIKALPDLGNGTLGIEGAFDYYSWGQSFTGYSWSYKFIPIGVTANYHFKLDEPKIDPFIGAGLGYNVVSCSGSGAFGTVSCGYSSNLYFIGRVGARYFFAPKMAVYADAGAGGAAFNVGVTFKIQ
jgi:outer membrane protein W